MLRPVKILLLSLALIVSAAALMKADCPVGDLNDDCIVNAFDLALLATSWLEKGTPPAGSVVINEVMSHSHGIAPDWIELYNTTGGPIDISGWYLSDNDLPLTKYRIADGTIIDADDYIVFYEDVNFGVSSGDPGSAVGFGLSENGESVYLSFGLDGQLAGLCDERDFGASENGVSFGRYVTSIGTEDFVAIDYNTPGGLNSYPKVGPIVIKEIMYNPGDIFPDAEYVELYNVSGATITLYDSNSNVEKPWRFTDSGGIEFYFPEEPPITIGSGEYILLVKNLAAFNAAPYSSVPGDVNVFEWVDGKLSNSGERLEISMPGEADPCDPGIHYYIRVDHVEYSDGKHHENFPGLDPWPLGPDGEWETLNRNISNYGNDVINWYADDPSPGL